MIGELRSIEKSLSQIDRIKSEQVVRNRNNLRTEYGLKETPNALLDLPGDLFQYNVISCDAM